VRRGVRPLAWAVLALIVGMLVGVVAALPEWAVAAGAGTAAVLAVLGLASADPGPRSDEDGEA
jgi:hypothetical protein